MKVTHTTWYCDVCGCKVDVNSPNHKFMSDVDSCGRYFLVTMDYVTGNDVHDPAICDMCKIKALKRVLRKLEKEKIE